VKEPPTTFPSFPPTAPHPHEECEGVGDTAAPGLATPLPDDEDPPATIPPEPPSVDPPP
jgi:hypothetical protein